jgi:hypothetical protein
MFRKLLCLAAILALAGCGGGGNTPADSTVKNQTPNSDEGGSLSPNSPSAMDWRFDLSAPQTLIDSGSASYLTALGTGSREPPAKAEVSVSLTQAGRGYKLSFQSGAFDNGRYFSDLRLPAAQVSLNPTNRLLSGLKTTQFEGSVGVDQKAYAASIQVLSEAGIGVVGMGHWKLLGDQQMGYYSGTRNMHGAFLFGQPSTPEAVSHVPTGAYGGYAQGGGETHWWDTFDQVTGKTSVHYDADNHTVTIRLSGLSYYNSSFSTSGAMTIGWNAASDVNPVRSYVCTGPVDSASGTFTCQFSSGLSGRIKGRFFGPMGEYVAGTFSLSGTLSGGSYDDALVGGFLTRRITDAVTPSMSNAWVIAQTALDFTQYIANASFTKLKVIAPAAVTQPVFAVVMDSYGQISPYVSVNAVDGSTNQFEVQISALSSRQVGQQSGTLELRLCYDDPLICTRPVSGSPWAIPYKITSNAYPGPGIVLSSPLLEGFTYDGQRSLLSSWLSFNEPAVNGIENWESYQYRYTVTGSGVLTSLNPTDMWWNRSPGSFAQAVLNFAIDPGVQVGLYEGVVSVAVCGLDWSDQKNCLPVERPQFSIPYKVEVRSWTDMRPLSIAPEIQATVNRRGSKQERLSFPLITDPAKISVRWKIPRAFNAGWGVGQGIIFGRIYDNGQSTLAVYRESDGQLMWKQVLPQPASNGDEYSISASNNRIFVRVGWVRSGFTLVVYDAATGAKLLEKSGGGERVWEQEFDHGWAVHNEYGANVPMSLWIYDDRTDKLQEITSMPHGNASFLPEEIKQIRQVFYGNEAPFAPLAEPLATQCGQDRNLNPSASFWRMAAAGVYCFSPARSLASWAIPIEQQQAEPGYPLEAGGTVLYQANYTLMVRDALSGLEVTRIENVIPPYYYTELARSTNLVFIGTRDSLRAIDIATGKTMWTLPYSSSVVGISNAGVLYAEMELNGEFNVVAINLRP